MAVTGYLVDTSALARMGKPAVAEAMEPLLRARRVAVCGPVELELRYSARTPEDYEGLVDELLSMPSVPVDETSFRRAIEVQDALAGRGQLRLLPLADLLVAAAAEIAGLTVLHYDADFDLVANATGQPTEWVVDPGTAD